MGPDGECIPRIGLGILRSREDGWLPDYVIMRLISSVDPQNKRSYLSYRSGVICWGSDLSEYEPAVEHWKYKEPG